MLQHPGSSWGFGALLKGTSVVVLRVKRALYIHCPHLQFLPARDSNSQPLGYESDSLTIRPRLDGFTCSFCLLQMLTDGLEWCGLLVDYCDVFISCLDSHSDGTHSLQRIHCWDSEWMHFSKSDEGFICFLFMKTWRFCYKLSQWSRLLLSALWCLS